MTTHSEDPSRRDAERAADLDPIGHWEFLIREAEATGADERARQLRSAGPPPSSTRPFDLGLSPQVFAVEVGADPGGAVAVAVAALHSARLSLVIVLGDAEAARFTRFLLDLLGRSDVAVVRGSAPAPAASAIYDLVPPDVPAQPADPTAAVRTLTAGYPYVIRWASYGALTDLAAVLTADPTLADRLLCYLAVGEDASITSADRAAASATLQLIHEPPRTAQDPRVHSGSPDWPHLVTEPIQQHQITADEPLLGHLANPAGPPWARLLSHHADQWLALGRTHISTFPALTIAEQNDVPYLDVVRRKVIPDATGGIRIDPSGTDMWLSAGPALDMPLVNWVYDVFGYHRPPGTRRPG